MKKRKGQYLSLETVLTLTIGLTIAIGSIALFSGYRDELLQTGKEEQIEMVQAKVTTTIYSLESVDEGYRRLELPNKLGGDDYQIILNEGVTVTSGSEETSSNRLNNLASKYSFSGSAPGGTVKIFKTGDQYNLRVE